MAIKQLADDLRAARAVIEKPEAWTRRAYAKTANNRQTRSPLSENAVRFCVLGAICRAVGEPDYGMGRSSRASSFLLGFVPLNRRTSVLAGIVAFNDRKSTTHVDILALFDRAIAAAEAS
ncbi:MAG: hypothetical protein V4564_07590 [Pseudomonadota bacterium]